ncbi:MAG: hypothetical protein IPO92_19550 [Saprospiraceae bacterium]|nr:hypothetical protein [Saprospiraceae bacterium]
MAYHKSVTFVKGKPAFVSLGISYGLLTDSLEYVGFKWPSQMQVKYFDPSIDHEYIITGSNKYKNLNVGLAFKGNITSSILMNMGISMYHSNSPNISFPDNYYKIYLKPRMTAYTKLDVMINSKWSINPSLYYTKQGVRYFYMIGSDVTYHINPDNAISLGGGYGKNTEPYVNLGANIKRLTIGLNYGFTKPFYRYKLECIVGYLITKNKCP